MDAKGDELLPSARFIGAPGRQLCVGLSVAASSMQWAPSASLQMRADSSRGELRAAEGLQKNKEGPAFRSISALRGGQTIANWSKLVGPNAGA